MKQFFTIALLLAVGAFFGYLSMLKGLEESVSWWLLVGAVICLILGAIGKAADMEGDNEDETSIAMTYFGMAATFISGAAFVALWLQPQSIETYKFAGVIVAMALSILEAVYFFSEVFPCRKKSNSERR